MKKPFCICKKCGKKYITHIGVNLHIQRDGTPTKCDITEIVYFKSELMDFAVKPFNFDTIEFQSIVNIINTPSKMAYKPMNEG